MRYIPTQRLEADIKKMNNLEQAQRKSLHTEWLAYLESPAIILLQEVLRDIRRMQKQALEKEADILRLTNEITAIQTSRAQQRPEKACQINNPELSSLNQTIAELTEEVRQLAQSKQDQAASWQQERQRLQAEKAVLQKECDDAKKSAQRADAKIQNQKAEINKQKKAFDSAEKEHTKQNNANGQTIETQQEEIKTLKKQIGLLSDEVKKLQDHAKTIEALKKALTDAESKKTTAEDRLTQIAALALKHELELNEARKQLRFFRSQTGFLNKIHSIREAWLARDRNSQEEITKFVAENGHTVSQLINERAASQEIEFEKLNNEIEQLNKKIQIQEKVIAALREQEKPGSTQSAASFFGGSRQYPLTSLMLRSTCASTNEPSMPR